MKSHISRNNLYAGIRACLLLAAFLIPSAMFAERVALITNATDQLSTNSAHKNLNDLIDGKFNTSWTSDTGDQLETNQYIIVKLYDNLTLGDDECLVIYTQRHETEEGPSPTTFKIEVSENENGENWETWAYAYLLYRGKSSKEYSARLTKQTTNNFSHIRRLRLTVTANNTRTRNLTTGARAMTMAEFQIYKLGKEEYYDAKSGLIDRLHYQTDYSLNYYDWNFEFTRGIVNKANNIDNWEWKGGTDGKWNQDTKELEKFGIEMPDMSFATSADDTDLEGTTGDQKRQRTHVTEHELYAIPGDAIALYPYYQLSGTPQYEDNFSHWYDYHTGGRVLGKNAVGKDFDLLDFLIDPSLIVKGDKFGYIGGKAIVGEKRIYEQHVETVDVNNPAEYKAFVDRVNNGEVNLNMNITNNLNFDGITDVMPMGSSSMPYCGIINGNSHTISNLKIEKTNKSDIGIVGYGGDGLIIRDLIVANTCSFLGNSRVALVASTIIGDNNKVKFRNVAVLANFTSNTGVNVAGFHGCHQSGNGSFEFANCYFGGIVNGINDCAAFSGWLGGNNTDHRFFNCYSNGVVNGNVKGDKTTPWSNNLAVTDASDEELSAMFINCYSSSPKDNIIAQIPDNYSQETFQQGKGTVYVSTPDDYKNFVDRVNNGETGLNMIITADLDFTGLNDIKPIGTNTNIFVGAINGNGHTLKNLVISMPTEEGVGMIGYGGNGMRISDLILDEGCRFEGKCFVGIIGVTNHSIGMVEIENIRMYGASIAANQNAGGIHGCQLNPNGILIFRDCYTTGAVTGGRESAAISGWIGANGASRIINCFSTATITGQSNNNELARMQDGLSKKTIYQNCYTKTGDSDYGIKKIPAQYLNDPITFTQKLKELTQLRQTDGAVATFFYPRNPYEEEGNQQGLPIDPKNHSNNQNEYVIAADFSQTYSESRNMDRENKRFIEPIIAFRHIFRIKDGKKFADSFSSTKDSNENYVRKHMHHVTARAGVKFQIRFDSPIPAEGTTRSKYYYKISNQDYRRVCTMGIKVLDADTRKEVNDITFYPDEKFDGQGSREVDGIKYQICGGGGSYYRMLKCDAPKEGRYIVQLIGKDINGDKIIIPDGSGAELIVMEYLITFLPEASASMITEDVLAQSKFEHQRSEYLEEHYGKPAAVVNFDNYRHLESLGNKSDYLFGDNGEYLFKWPAAWNKSTYAFGYNVRHDFNMYMIANNSVRTPYKEGVEANSPDGDGKLRDRLYYDTRKETYEGEKKAGYFYYVNASTDPGVMAKLKIDDLCLGSTLYVSAWVAEFSKDKEKANVAFNFMAVLKNGTRVPLHTFVTGYVPDVEHCGKWMHVYYSFIPSYGDTGITADQVQHYELELDNNCKKSNGADYAIDDIRVYVAKPNVFATQLTEVCDPETNSVTIRLEAPFQMLLETLGLEEASSADKEKDINLYYTIVDKNKFDKEYNEFVAQGDDKAGEKAYNNSVLHYNYDGSDATGKIPYGKITFSNFYNNDQKNPEYDQKSAVIGNAYRWIDNDTKERLIVLHTIPVDGNISKGGVYTIAFYTSDKNDETVGWGNFNMLDNCAKKKDFRIKASGIVKIDGVIIQDASNISICENMSPVVQINLFGKKTEDGPIEEVEKNAFFDWYDGSLSDFNQIIVTDKAGNPLLYDEKDTDGNTVQKEMPLSYALLKFRHIYPNATECNLKATPPNNAEGFTEDMCLFIEKLSTEIIEGKEQPTLLLHKSSYLFPPLKLKEGETETMHSVLAIPFDYNEGKYIICAMPTEVRLKVVNQAPVIKHGFTDIDYPISSVPLRIGLKHIDKVSYIKDSSNPEKLLDIPIRIVESTNEGIKDMTWFMKDGGIEDKSLYLVETNDPEYKDLGTIEGDKEIEHLMAIGELTEFTASVTGPTADNVYQAKFYNNFRFKEGYYYTLRFNFKEDASTITLREGEVGDGGAGIGGNPGGGSTGSEGETEETVECVGHDLITIKVVPEYQMWTGGESLNFNDDRNWRRVSSDELLRAKDDNDRFTTNGSNDNAFSYAPLDFTKVIIPAGEKYPHLYDWLTSATEFDGITGYNGSAGTEDREDKIGKKVKWNENPNPAADADAIGNVTANVQYDMVAYQPTDAEGFVKCRTWYANACEQIHFHANSEIMSQQHLLYDKAWADMEMNPDRWYLAASPLQDVVAGDMYLPTDGARQLTELFQDITFEKGKNDRFAPAVFQRGWNKATANVYKLPSAGESPENVAVSLDWSHVYNDVKEPYSGGMGYSVKTDVSKATNFNDKVSGFDSEKPGTVLFRFPKADTSYDYWNQEGNTNGNNTVISRTKAYRLNETGTNESPATITLANAGGSKYFLAGNPFMAHLDMAKFFEANSSAIQSKYWIMTADSQQSAIFDKNTKEFSSTSGTDTDASTLAPMQGFFVEAKDASATLNLKFTPDMITVKSYKADDGIQLQAAGTRAGNGGEGMLITAYNDEGSAFNPALVRASADADKDYRDSEDVLFLDNPDCMTPKVFTIAGNKAVSINTLDDAEGTEVGVIAPEGYVSYLTFENTSDFSYLSLLDTSTGEATPLYDGLEVEVTGPATGRFFLTASAGTPETELLGLRFEVVGNDVTVYAPAADTGLEVSAYTVSGMTAASVYCEGEATLALDSGIYIITARASDGTSLRRKIVIK